LARTVCPSCATKYFPSGQELAEAGLPDKAGRPFHRGEGCDKCHDTGFRGRLGVYEVMEVTPEVRRLIHRGAAAHEIRDFLRKQGVGDLRSEGVQLALEGRTSLDEILRVTHGEDEEDAQAPRADTNSDAKGAA
jgi:type II secretory ATPase GspE/PulE/Tfp pilus assembly ATPase PilB-like protein